MKVLLVDNFVMPKESALDLLDTHPHLGLLSLAAVGALEFDINFFASLVEAGILVAQSTLNTSICLPETTTTQCDESV